jgi:hypothetical protein
MNALIDWMIVGAGFAIGMFLVAVAVITVKIAILAVFFIIEEISK